MISFNQYEETSWAVVDTKSPNKNSIADTVVARARTREEAREIRRKRYICSPKGRYRVAKVISDHEVFLAGDKT